MDTIISGGIILKICRRPAVLHGISSYSIRTYRLTLEHLRNQLFPHQRATHMEKGERKHSFYPLCKRLFLRRHIILVYVSAPHPRHAVSKLLRCDWDAFLET
jgi:hypothetical protein